MMTIFSPVRFAVLICAAFLWLVPRAEAGRRVLFLGDSMSLGAFGKTLDRELRAAGHSVYTVVTGGATPYYWLKEFETVSSDIGYWVKTPDGERRVQVVRAVPKLEDLLKQYKPEIVIVQTGSNLYASLRSKRQTAEERVRTVEYLCDRMCRVAAAEGKSIYWITPPDAHEQRFPRELQEQMRQIMCRTAGRYGRVFDSYAVTKYTDPYPQNDGIHYGPTESAEWAQRVAADALGWLPRAKGRAGVAEAKETIRKAKAVESADNTLDVDLELVAKSEFTAPREITYRNGLAIYEYEVKRVHRGHYAGRRLRVAHMVMQNRKVLSTTRWAPGKRVQLELVPLSTYPNLEKIETLDSLPEAPDLPIFTPKL